MTLNPRIFLEIYQMRDYKIRTMNFSKRVFIMRKEIRAKSQWAQ